MLNGQTGYEQTIYDDAHKHGYVYIYLIDHEQKVMLILKRNITELRYDVESTTSIQELLNNKLRNLSDRINENGHLSVREIEILNYAAFGISNRQIADTLKLSESTVKHHLSRIMKKMNANDRTHAVTLAIRNRWLDLKNIAAQTD